MHLSQSVLWRLIVSLLILPHLLCCPLLLYRIHQRVEELKTSDQAQDLVKSSARLSDFSPFMGSFCQQNEIMDFVVCQRPAMGNGTVRVTSITYNHTQPPPESDQSRTANLKREYIRNITEAIDHLLSVMRN